MRKKNLFAVILVCVLLLPFVAQEIFAASSKVVSANAVESFVQKAESKNGSGRFSGIPSSGSWCGYFVAWAMKNSDLGTEISNLGDSITISSLGGSCDPLMWAARKGYGTIYIAPGSKAKHNTDFYYNRFVNGFGGRDPVPNSNVVIDTNFSPQRGDVVLYDWIWDVDGDFDHTGIMTSSTGTIEGNTSGGIVAKRNLTETVYDSSGNSHGKRGEHVCAYFRFNTNITLRVPTWASSEAMGNSTDEGLQGEWYYYCYQLVVSQREELVNAVYPHNYTVRQEIYNPDGTLEFSHEYSNSDNNWIRFAAKYSGTYTLKLTITGDIAGRNANFTKSSEFYVQPNPNSMTVPSKTISLTLGDKESETIPITINGYENVALTARWEKDNENISTVWEKREGNTAFLTITAKALGTTTLKIHLLDTNTKNRLSTIILTVNVSGKSSTVYFDATGGSVSPSSKTVTYGGTYGELPVPQKALHRFEGWFTDPIGGIHIMRDNIVNITSNQTLYAHWTQTLLAEGLCGENLTWSLSLDGVLTIRGTGNMDDYDYGGAPWHENRDSIVRVVLQDGVISIGRSAFYNCKNLAHVEIPNSVISIGDSVFEHCKSLINITIPDSVTSIGYRLFNWCDNLKRINIGVGNAYYSDIDGILFNKEQTVLRCYPAGISNKSYTIPDSVSKVDFSAFNNCTTLTHITIPESVKTIESDTFEKCDNLTTVYYSGSEQQWSEIYIGTNNDPLFQSTIRFSSDAPDLSLFVLRETGGVTASISVSEKIDFNPTRGTLICAVYDANGKCLNTWTKTVSVDGLYMGQPFISCDTQQAHTVKLFFLDAEYAPLCNAVEDTVI